jgi:hypothetical protein
MRKLLCILMLTTCAAISAEAQRTATEVGMRPAPVAARIPNPVLVWKGLDVNVKGSDGNSYIGLSLGVSNYAEFPALLFTSAPELPACGENKAAARAWLRVFDAKTNKLLYSFCGMASSTEMRTFSFNMERAQLPAEVYVVLEDRAAKKTFQSNCLKTADGKPCAAVLIVAGAGPLVVTPAFPVSAANGFRAVHGRDPNPGEEKFWQEQVSKEKLTQEALVKRILERLTDQPDVFDIGEMKAIVDRAYQKAGKGWPTEKEKDYWANRILARTAYYQIILDALK